MRVYDAVHVCCNRHPNISFIGSHTLWSSVTGTIPVMVGVRKAHRCGVRSTPSRCSVEPLKEAKNPAFMERRPCGKKFTLTNTNGNIRRASDTSCPSFLLRDLRPKKNIHLHSALLCIRAHGAVASPRAGSSSKWEGSLTLGNKSQPGNRLVCCLSSFYRLATTQNTQLTLDSPSFALAAGAAEA